MSEKEGDEVKASHKPKEKPMLSGIRHMVEEMTVTPFFKRHSSHMPATIKLHAEIIEKDDCVILKTLIPGFHEDFVDVSASENNIHIKIRSGEEEEVKTSELTHEDNVILHSAYVTPVPVNPDKLKVSRKGEVLEVKVPKKK